MGWLSIMEPDSVKKILNIPPHVSIIAYMTVGYPVEFPETPLLEAVGWRQREALKNVVFNNGWNEPYVTDDAESVDSTQPEQRPPTPSILNLHPIAKRTSPNPKEVLEDWNPSPYKCVRFNKPTDPP